MKYINEKAPSVKSKVKQINKKISKLVSKKEDAVSKAKEMADSEEPSGKMQASLAKIQLRQSESEAEKLMLQKQAEILKAKIDTAKKKEKTTANIEEMENRPITILEGVMSDIHQMISNHKNFDSFQKEFFKEYGHKKVMKKTPEFLEWLEALYNDSQFAVAESVVTEAKFFRLPAKLNAMWELKNAVDYIVGKHDNGDDYKPEEMKTIEEFIKKIKQSAKAFKSAEEVEGTVYESVVTEGILKISGDAYDLWDDEEVQRELRDVKIKIVGNIGGVATIKGSDDELQKVKDILGLNESVVNEAKRLSFKDAGITNTMDLNNAMNTLRDSGIDWDQKGQAFVFVSSKDHTSAIKALGLEEGVESEIGLSDKLGKFKHSKPSKESESPNNITCGNCSWTWLKQDGGDDMYTCHKCGTDNAPSLGESMINEEDTYNDYPAAAKKNAKKALDWRDEHGRDEVDAGTAVGWTRANQLAKGEKISADTVKRMASFNRHRKNSSIKAELKGTPWKDKGYVSWLIWGGDEGVDWAMKKSKEIDNMKESKQMKYIKQLNEAEKYITDEFKVGDKIKTNFGEWEVIETDYAPKKSFIAPFIFKGKDMERVNIPNPPRTNKKAVGYKVTDGDKYPIIGFLYQYKDITKLATVGVDESVVTEKLARGLKPLLTLGSTIDKKVGEDALLDLSDKFDRIDDEYAGTIASWLDMAIELMQDGYAGDATKKLKQFNKACKDVLNGKDIGSAFESVVAEGKSSKEKFEEESGYFQEMINDPKKRVYDIVDFAQFTTGGMTEKQWEMFMYGRYKKHLQSTDAKIKEKMYDVLTKWLTESVDEGIYAKKSKIVPGEYIKTQYGYFYKRVEGTVGGEDAYVEIKKGKEGKKKTGIHDTVDFDIVDKSIALSESVTEGKFSPMGYAKRVVDGSIKIKDAMKEAGISLGNIAKLIKKIDKSFDVDAAFLEKNVMQDDPEKFVESSKLKYIRVLNEGVDNYTYNNWIKENGKIKYPKWIEEQRKEVIKQGLMQPVYDSESQNMIIWINSFGKKFFPINADSKKREKEFGKNGSEFINRFYNDLTGYSAFFWQAATICLEIIRQIEDLQVNGEPIEPSYYLAKEYFNNHGLDTNRSRIFNSATEKLAVWMKDNNIETL